MNGVEYWRGAVYSLKNIGAEPYIASSFILYGALNIASVS